jgi:hypothetical protein
MSLRHLFSTDYAKSQLRLAYLGPVINGTGQIETSPDALILDMRRSPHRVKRCEFKFAPTGPSEFSHNGKFDMAVIWDVATSTTKEALANKLLEQNGCSEVVRLVEHSAFCSLPLFSYEHFNRSTEAINAIEKLVVKRELHSVVALYIAAQCFPSPINSKRVVEFLAKKYVSVARMKPQGRGNIISAFMQTNPPLIRHMNLDNYSFNIDFDSKTIASVIGALLRERFSSEPPSDDEIRSIPP